MIDLLCQSLKGIGTSAAGITYPLQQGGVCRKGRGVHRHTGIICPDTKQGLFQIAISSVEGIDSLLFCCLRLGFGKAVAHSLNGIIKLIDQFYLVAAD